jgi:hypothetical protein
VIYGLVSKFLLAYFFTSPVYNCQYLIHLLNQFKMFYNSKWKSGFLTGLVTGLVIYAIAKSPRGRGIISRLRPVADVLKDQVNRMSTQATDLLDSTVQVAENISNRETSAVSPGASYSPGGTYSADEAYSPGRL